VLVPGRRRGSPARTCGPARSHVSMSSGREHRHRHRGAKRCRDRHRRHTGRVTIRALARDYRECGTGQVVIRVSNTIEIDRVVPIPCATGAGNPVWRGTGRISRVTLGDRPDPDPRSRRGLARRGSARYWVPIPPGQTDAGDRVRRFLGTGGRSRRVVVPANVYLFPVRITGGDRSGRSAPCFRRHAAHNPPSR